MSWESKTYFEHSTENTKRFNSQDEIQSNSPGTAQTSARIWTLSVLLSFMKGTTRTMGLSQSSTQKFSWQIVIINFN
jgi:hypothetical protein